MPGHDTTGVPRDAVLARSRQLAAHEVGHSLGLEHNYIASTQGRASVMDYPGPHIDVLPDNTLSLANAYAKASVNGTKSAFIGDTGSLRRG